MITVKSSLRFLLYGMAAIGAMAGVMALPTVNDFIQDKPLITIAMSIGLAIFTKRIVESIPGD